MVWVGLALMVAMLAASFFLMPRTSSSSQKPSTIDDISFPTATAGKEIPVVFGTRWITSPNVVWYGDLRTRPVRTDSGK